LVVSVEWGKYPQQVKLEFVQDKITLLNGLQPGQELKLSFKIGEIKYNECYCNYLQEQPGRLNPIVTVSL
jgi:hypothetical protein